MKAAQEPFLANAVSFVPHPDARVTSRKRVILYQVPAMADVVSVSDVKRARGKSRPYLELKLRDGSTHKLYGYYLEDSRLQRIASDAREMLRKKKFTIN